MRAVWLCLLLAWPSAVLSAPYAAVVMDARSGEVLHARNADTRLHPASLTKMMTLYITFEAIKRGEISLDTKVRISKKAAAEPPSKLGLKAGQRIALRYLIRAAAVKSANDAATAIGEAISGSEAAFARRMNRTAKALGMTRTTFKNANGLTESGHLSTARDMTILGRHIFYDHPEYYNLFSRITTTAGGKTIANTNRKFLGAYRGADGIKTGYTRAAGFNLVASAERGQERIIATVFGGRSTASRNAKVAELLDLGFRRAPSRVAVNKPRLPTYQGNADGGAGKTIRVSGAVKKTPRPIPRPRTATSPAPSEPLLLAMKDGVSEAVAEANAQPHPPVAAAPEAAPVKVATGPTPVQRPSAVPAPTPVPAAPVTRAVTVALDTTPPSTAPRVDTPMPRVITRASTSGGRHWGISLGEYTSRYKAERVLLKTALSEIETLDEALRKVVSRRSGHEASFVGMSQARAEMACKRLTSRGMGCTLISP
ncbi:MAG: D-alanyl-D-alanine carboxypeptidase family protein [Brevirhabdus sp.]